MKRRRLTSAIVLSIIIAATYLATSQPIGGPVGIPRVTHDSTMTGSGTPANPLALSIGGASCSAGQAMTALGGSGVGTCSNISTAGVSTQVSTSTGTLNDFSLSSGTTTLVFTNAAGATINGITGGADGRVLFVVNNTGSAILTFAHEAGGSTTSNRIAGVASSNWIANINSVTALVYRGTQARWMLVKDYEFPQINVATNANITGNVNAAAGTLSILHITSTGDTTLGNNSSDTVSIPSVLNQTGAATFSSTLTANSTVTTTGDTNIGNGGGDDLVVLGDTANMNTTTISLGTSATNDFVNIGGAGDTAISFLNGPAGVNRYEGRHLEWADEFTWRILNATSVTRMGPLEWVYQNNSSAWADPNGTLTGRFGVIALDTLTASVPASNYARLAAQNFIDLGNTTTITLELTSRFDVLSSTSSGTPSMYAARWGLTDASVVSSSGDVTNGIYLMYDKGNTATGGPNGGNADAWSCWSANASTRTKYLINNTGNSDASFALGVGAISANTWMRWRIKITTTAGTPTRAEFFTIASGGVATKVCNIETNLPGASTMLMPEILIMPKATTGTGSRQWQLDQLMLAIDLSASRSP